MVLEAFLDEVISTAEGLALNWSKGFEFKHTLSTTSLGHPWVIVSVGRIDGLSWHPPFVLKSLAIHLILHNDVCVIKTGIVRDRNQRIINQNTNNSAFPLADPLVIPKAAKTIDDYLRSQEPTRTDY